MFLCFFAKFQSSNKVLCKNDYKCMALEPKHNNTCVFYNYQGKETDLLIAFSVIKWLYYPHSVTKKDTDNTFYAVRIYHLPGSVD